MLKIKNAEFVKSITHLKDSPQPALPEIAIVGRSNVGKSSLINMLTGFTRLAKISGTPGKTKTINHFLINGRVVPGRSARIRIEWASERGKGKEMAYAEGFRVVALIDDETWSKLHSNS